MSHAADHPYRRGPKAPPTLPDDSQQFEEQVRDLIGELLGLDVTKCLSTPASSRTSAPTPSTSLSFLCCSSSSRADQGLVQPVVVVFLDEGIEASLLLQHFARRV